MGFLGHNSGYGHSRRSIKGSIDADDRLVSTKILSQKMVLWIGAQGLVKLVKYLNTCPLCAVTKRKPHTQIKYLFLIKARRLAESMGGLNSSLAVAAGGLWPKMCRPL